MSHSIFGPGGGDPFENFSGSIPPRNPDKDEYGDFSGQIPKVSEDSADQSV